MGTRPGARLKAAREKLGYSRSFVAKQAGIDPAALFRIENNANAAPTFETMRKVAAVLGVSLDWLAGGGELLQQKARVAEARRLENSEKARVLLERALSCLTHEPAESGAAAGTRSRKRR